MAKRYTQQGVVFLDVVSLWPNLLQLKFASSCIHSHWHLAQLDGDNAFLNGDLMEGVYMEMSLGYQSQAQKCSSSAKLVCRLHKFIYELRQASCQ